MVENLDYNTSRASMIIKEYGRNVQNMIEHITVLEDREERNQLAEVIVNLMASKNPQEKNNPDFIQKLWNHLYKISNYKIDIDKTVFRVDGEGFESESKIDYPSTKPKFRHYGRVVEEMIYKCSEMEEGEVKTEFLRLVVSYMKSAYKNWSKENVSDDAIITDLERISGGKLTYQSDEKIASFGGPSNEGGRRYSNNNNNRRRRHSNNNNNNNRRRSR